MNFVQIYTTIKRLLLVASVFRVTEPILLALKMVIEKKNQIVNTKGRVNMIITKPRKENNKKNQPGKIPCKCKLVTLQ